MTAAALAAFLLTQAHELRTGSWNARVHAVHTLERAGKDALPLLREAALDADWQVRMTAVHEMGRLGKAGLPALETVLAQEPCPTVRLTALHWMGSMGPDADAALKRALEDESGMVRLMGKYWLKKDGKSDGGEPWEAEAAAREERKACVASPEPRKAPWAGKKRRAPAAEELPPVDEVVITRDPVLAKDPEPAAPPPPEPSRPPLPKERLAELDSILEPETLPPPPPGFGERPAPETSGADYAAAGGKNKTETLPDLIALLGDKDAAKRARAADELGKRGADAAPAVEPLTKALKDSSPRVRASAALALGNVGAASDAAVPALVAMLRRGGEEAAWSAAIALGRIGTPRARKAFSKHARETAGELVRPAPKKP